MVAKDGIGLMRRSVLFLPLIVLLSCFAVGQNPDFKPARWTADKAFLSGLAFDAVATSLDGYVTSTLIRPSSPMCNVEGISPWLYGRHPQPARVAITMGAEFVTGVTAAYLLRKAHAPKWVYSGFMVGQGSAHLAGYLQTVRRCR